jgi:hypothetical protein
MNFRAWFNQVLHLTDGLGSVPLVPSVKGDRKRKRHVCEMELDSIPGSNQVNLLHFDPNNLISP